MDCKVFEKQIPEFLKGRMGVDREQEFLQHFEECGACREELSIEFLVTVGLERLEAGDAFHLNRELMDKIRTSSRQVQIRKSLRRFVCALDLAAIVCGLWILLYFV